MRSGPRLARGGGRGLGVAPARRVPAALALALALGSAAAAGRPIPQPAGREHDTWEGLDDAAARGVDPDALAGELEDMSDHEWEGKILSADPELAARLNVTGTPKFGSQTPSGGASDRVAFSLFAIGSWGRPSPDLAAVAGAMTRRAAHVRPMAVLTTGDNFCGRGVRGESDALWDVAYRRPFRRLHEPFYATLGPCDYYGNVEAEVAYRAHRRDARWAMPARNYSRTFRVGSTSAHVIFLDTVPLALDRAVAEAQQAGGARAAALSRRLKALRDRAAPQLAWVEAELASAAAARATWRIVVGNYPMLSAGPDGGTRALRRDILPRLRRGGADLYLSGHDPGQQHLVAHGIDMIVTAAGGGRAPAPPSPRTPHLRFGSASAGFAEVDVAASALTLRLVDSSGRVLYSARRRANSGGRRPSVQASCGNDPGLAFAGNSPLTRRQRVRQAMLGS